MNCTTCGNALPAGGGECTICNPWLTPTSARERAPAAVGMPTVDPQAIPKMWVRIVQRHPAAAVDLGRAYRRGLLAFAINLVTSITVGLLALHYATNSVLWIGTADLLTIAPFVLATITSAAIVGRKGGWLGAAVSNLQLRPDIGLPWLFQLPAMKRLRGYSMVAGWSMLLFIFYRGIQHPATYSGVHSVFMLTGYFYLFRACLGIIGLVGFNLPAFRIIQARLAVPPPAYVPVPFPMPAPYGAVPYPNA